MNETTNKKYGTLIKDTLIFALGSIGSKLMLFILVPLYTNCLTTDEYGYADLIFTFAQLIVPILSLTIYDAVLRFGLAKDENPSNVLLCALVVWGCGSLLTIATTPLVGLYPSMAKWQWYLCVYVIVQMLLSIQQNYLKTVNKNTLYATVSLLHALTLALLNICLLLWVNLRIEGFLIANILATLFMVIFSFIFGKMGNALKNGKFEKALLKKMIIFSSPLILNNISWWVIQSSNKVIVETFLGASVLGIYTVATKIPALINVIITIFSQAWGISSIREKESTSDTSFYSSVFSVFTFLAFGACIAVVTVIKPFITIYVGESFASCWTFVPVLLLSAVFSAISSYCGSLYGALKKSVNNMVSTLVAAVVGIGFTLLFINTLNLWAAIIGTLLSYFTIASIRLWDVRRFIKFKINWFVFLMNVIIASVQVYLVTIGWHMVVVSIICLVAFVAVNASTIIKTLKRE